jgi:hypothetical protein
VAGITLTVDTSEVSRMSVTLARLMGQYEWIAARAMTEAAKSTRTALQREILPKIEGGPTNWTKRGLIVRYASRNNLQAMVGFQYGEGSFNDSEFTRKAGGIPAGRYMGINARGGDRRPKGSELQLRRAGLIGNDQFITPPSTSSTQGGGVKLNAQGNLPGAEYQRILSRMRALSGGVGNAPQGAGSRGRSGKARREVDYFMLRGVGGTPSRWQLGADPMAVAKRAGRGPKGGTGKGSGNPGRPQTVGYRRGFVRALFVVDQPNYERRFPIRVVAEREFARAFPIQFERALAKELEFQRNRR